MTLPRGLLKSLIREGYSAPDAMREAWRRVKKNPGVKWHGKEATRAEGDRWESVQSGKLLGSFYHQGKRDAHRESQTASRQMGLNPREDIPYKVGERIKYRREFLRSIAWHTNVPRAGTVTALQKMGPQLWPVIQWDEFFPEPIMVNPANIMPAKRPDRNPGAAWHLDQEKLAEDMEKRETRPRRKTYLKGMADAHTLSAHESRKMGLNPGEKIGQAKAVSVRQAFRKSRRAWEWKGRRILHSGGPGAVELEPGTYLDLQTGVVYKKNPMYHVRHLSKGKLVGWTKVSARSPESAIKRAVKEFLHPGPGSTFKAKLYHGPGPLRRERPKRNPIAVYNPPPGRMIYGQVLAVHARKTNGTHRGKSFRHTFTPASRVAMYALPDGSVLLKSGEGKRLWQDIK